MAKTKEEKLLSKRLLELDNYSQVITAEEKQSVTVETTNEDYNFLIDLLKERAEKLAPKTKSPNEDLDLEEFDYKKFDASTPERIKSFIDYLTLAESLPMNKSYLYDKFFAKGIFKFRINEDTAEREKYLAGIVFDSTLINTCTTHSKNANLLNRQILSNHPKPTFLFLKQC